MTDDHPMGLEDAMFAYRTKAWAARFRGDLEGYYLNRMKADTERRKMERKRRDEEPAAKIRGLER